MISTKFSPKDGALAQFWQVYIWQMKKSRALSIVYGALTLFCVTMVFLCQSIGFYTDCFGEGSGRVGVSHQELMNSFSWDLVVSMNRQIYLALIPLSFLFVVVFCVTAFGYMHKRRSVDLFHALPIRRTPMLLGNLAAGFTILLVVLTVNCLLCGIIAFSMDAGSPFTLPWLLEGIGYLLLLLAAAMVLNLFLLVASGTVVNAVLSGILLSVSWPVLCYCGAAIIRMTLPGSSLEVTPVVATGLIPYLVVFIPFLNFTSANMAGTGDFAKHYNSVAGASYDISALTVLWWCGFILLLLAAAILIYRKRRSECAENNFSYPALRVVIQFLASGAFGLGCGMVFGEILNQNWIFFLAVVIGAALAHGSIQIIWVKGIRAFQKSLPAYGVLLAALCVFFVVLGTGGLGYVSRVPDTQDLKEVTIQLPDYHYDNSAKTYLGQLCELSLSSSYNDYYTDVSPKLQEKTSMKTVKELHQTIIDRYSAPYLPCHEKVGETCSITYQLSNGKTMERSYDLFDTEKEVDRERGMKETRSDVETLRKMAAVVALDEYQECSLYYYLDQNQVLGVGSERTDDKGSYMGDQSELTAAQKKKLWDTFRKELQSDQFSYTYLESVDAKNLGSGDTESSTTYYYLEMEQGWQGKNWTTSMYQMLKKNSGKDFTRLESKNLVLNSYNSMLLVPNSCPETQKLIKKYIGKTVEFVPNEDEEADKNTEELYD